MITPQVRTVLFVLACAVLGVGLYMILASVMEAPPSHATTEEIEQLLEGLIRQAGMGLVWVIGGTFLTLVIVLWNASALSKDWLYVLAYAYKGFGTLLAILLIALCLRQYQLHKVADLRRVGERLDTQTSAAAGAADARNDEKVAAFIGKLAEWSDKPAARNAAVAVAGSQLRDSESISLAMVQALYSVCLHDPDDEVRNTAREMVFPTLDPAMVFTNNDFAQTLVALLGEKPQLLEQRRYQGYVESIKKQYATTEPKLVAALIAIQEPRVEKVMQNKNLLASAQASLLDTAKIPTQNDASTVRDVLIAAGGTFSGLQQQALTVLDKADGPRLQTTIESLPAELRQSLPPRVYLHVAEEADRGKLAKMRDALRTVPLRSPSTTRTIVPGIQAVSNNAPSSTEVRYFAGEDSRRTAGLIANFLTDQGIKNVRLSQEVPTALDLKQTRDIAGHFEVWFAKGAVPR